MSDLIIRPVESFDIPVLLTLHQAAFTAPWDQRWSERSFAEILRMPGAGARIAALGTEPVGFVLARIAADEAELLLIGIHPAHRRQGLARALLDHVIAELRGSGVTRILLEVAESNQAALALYRAAGFRAVGRRPRYYQGESAADALILALPLEAAAASS